MARIRTIKPEFPQSESIGRLSRDARLLFVQLWTIVDDAGRARAASRMLASLLYPYDDDAPALIEGWLDELERQGCVRRYVVDGSHYLDIPKWLEHQKIDHASRSRLPEFSETLAKPLETSRSLAPDLGPRIKYQDSEANASSADALTNPDPKAWVFGELLHWLMTTTARKEDALRSWLGKCCGQYGDNAVVAAGMMVRAPPVPVDPIGAMTERLKRQAANGRVNGSKFSVDSADIRDPLAAAALARSVANGPSGAGEPGPGDSGVVRRAGRA